MAANPRVVTVDRQIFWDGVTQRLPKGQVLDVPPDSALEREIGRDYLVPMPGADAQEPEKAAPKISDALNEVTGALVAGEVLPEEAEPAAPPKPKPAAKKDDDAKDGDS